MWTRGVDIVGDVVVGGGAVKYHVAILCETHLRQLFALLYDGRFLCTDHPYAKIGNKDYIRKNLANIACHFARSCQNAIAEAAATLSESTP